MHLLMLSIFAIICTAAVESRYPYDDTFTSGDIVPHGINSGYGGVNRHGYGNAGHGYGSGNAGHGYGRDRGGRYPGRPSTGGGYGGGIYGGSIYGGGRNRYGRRHEDRDVLHRDINRRRFTPNLPPRGITGGFSRPHDRPGLDYGRNRPHINNGPDKYYDDYDVNYGGYNKVAGIDIRHN